MGILAGLAVAALALLLGALLSAWLGLPLGLLFRSPGAPPRRAGLAAGRTPPPAGGDGRR